MLMLALVLLPGCSLIKKFTGNSQESGTHYLKMEDLDPALTPFQSQDNYNFLGESVEYRQIGNPKYDEMFARAAFIKGSVQQLTAMTNQYQEGRLSLDTVEDFKFLRAMTVFGVRTLPSLTTEAPQLLGNIASLRPHRDLSPFDVPAALAGLDQMRSNLTGMEPAAITGLLDTVTSIQCQVAEVSTDSAPMFGTNC